MYNSEDIYLSLLLSLPKVGPTSLLKLQLRYSTFKQIWNNFLDWYSIYKNASELKTAYNQTSFEKESETLEVNKVQLLSWQNPNYPNLLKNIPDPPLLLYILGELKPLSFDKKIGVVGTRNPSSYGIDATFKIIQECNSKLCIVSGFQLGIDTAAHQAALSTNSKTIAVLGTGLDIDYPQGNSVLKDQILDSGNCLISEYRLGILPLPYNFPRRNRIISGLSQAVLVVEAQIKSGSLVTANSAIEQNRDVFAVPGSILSSRSYGPHYLISQGAKITTTGYDILSEYNLSALSNSSSKPKFIEYSNPLQSQIIAILDEELFLDQIVEKLKLQPSFILTELTMLELDGYISKRDNGSYYKI